MTSVAFFQTQTFLQLITAMSEQIPNDSMSIIHCKDLAIVRKKCYSYTLCCRPSNRDKLCHAQNAFEPHFIRVFPYSLRITGFLCHVEKLCDAETTTNV